MAYFIDDVFQCVEWMRAIWFVVIAALSVVCHSHILCVSCWFNRNYSQSQAKAQQYKTHTHTNKNKCENGNENLSIDSNEFSVHDVIIIICHFIIDDISILFIILTYELIEYAIVSIQQHQIATTKTPYNFVENISFLWNILQHENGTHEHESHHARGREI